MKAVSRISRMAFAVAMGMGMGAATVAPGWAEETSITWGKPAEITGFDVHVAGTVASWEMYQVVYETLLAADENLQLQGALAESWEQTSPTTYVFNLRKNAAFSNGRALVADDVIGSLERIQNPETASYWSRQLGDIAKMAAVDAHTVKIQLAEPHPAFLPALAHITAAIIPIKELKDGSFDPTSQMLGSGPFMVADHKQDEGWTLVRNPHHWAEGQPKVDRLEARIIPDESARIAALRDGRIDYTTFENPDAPQMMAKDANIEIRTQQTTNYYRIDVNALSKTSAFNDKRVRQAMNLALDRQAINDLVFAGTTKVDYPVPGAFGKAACKNLDAYALPREARLEKARALLAEAGKESPQVELIATTSDAVFGRIAQVVQQNLAEAGFNVTIAQMPAAEYLQKVFTDGDFDMSISWLAGYTDPSMVIAWWNPAFAVWNQTFQENVPALSAALDDVKKMQVGPERDAKLDEICTMIDDGANLLSLVSKIDYVAFRKDQIKVNVPERSGSSDTFQHIGEFEPID